MKTKSFKKWVISGILLAMACPAFGQTPPNDNIANATVLTGDDVFFNGTLNGATLEDSQEAIVFNSYGSPASQSVWWKWTAPTNTALTVQIVGSSFVQSNISQWDGIAIYQAAQNISSPADLAMPQSGIELIYLSLSPVTLSVPVLAGTNYYIQLIGSSSANYTLRLIATNTPVIVQQPRNLTVSSNASALFYVISAGTTQPTFTFQWRWNGTNLSGQTAPMLALTNIDSSMAGDYSVVVSNVAGSTTSGTAMLTVDSSNVPFSLATIAIAANSLEFSLSGEVGRMYRIQSSTDLINWTNEANFPLAPYWSNSTSVVLNSFSPLVLLAKNITPRKFLRAAPYWVDDAHSRICVNHLEQMHIAKLLWARDYYYIHLNDGFSYPTMITPNQTPIDSELFPYLPGGVGPLCPDDPNQTFDTSYNNNFLRGEPLCQIHPATHFVEEPQ